MTEHNRIRADRALSVKAGRYPDAASEIAALDEAIVGLQSTDDPSLCPLHDELQARRRELEKTGPTERAERMTPGDEIVAGIDIMRLETADFSQRVEWRKRLAQQIDAALRAHARAELLAAAEHIDQWADHEQKHNRTGWVGLRLAAIELRRRAPP